MNGSGEIRKPVDWWQRTIAIGTVAIAAIGVWATWTYNQQQMRFQHIETLAQFAPHLVSSDRRLSNMARVAVTFLPDKDLADELLAASIRLTTEDTATQPEVSQAELAERRPAKVAEAQGWAYLGDYSRSEKVWQTRYFEFDVGPDPDKFIGEELTVRQETGSLNLRIDMPTPQGTFPMVIDVLSPETKVKVLEVKPWQETGYMWAKISYSPK